MKILRDTLVLLTLIGSAVAADASDLGHWDTDTSSLDHKVYVGLWSEHWYADNPEFNEDNEVIQYSLYNKFHKGGEYFTAARFRNSYGDITHAVGYGQEYKVYLLPDVKVGWNLGIMHGYGDNLDVQWRDINPVVQFHFKFYDVLKIQFMGPAVNAGLEFTI